jgi:hypothetical protein
MSEQPRRVTVDEIEPNAAGRLMATLVADNGESFVVPLDLLPHGTRVNDVLRLALEPDPDETEQRHRRISDLQRRLFRDRQ